MEINKNIQIKNYKERIGSFFQKKIDFSGNLGKKRLLYRKAVIQQKQLWKLKKYFNKKRIKQQYFYYILMIFFHLKTAEINEQLTSIYINKALNIQKIIDKIHQLKKNLLEYKIKNQHKIFNILSRRLPRVFHKDANTGKIKRNLFYRLQRPGFPRFIYRFKRKLKKKLLIRRIRKKFKFIEFQQSLALHTFIGTKAVSYANLVKENKLKFLIYLYQYKLRLKTKKRTNFWEKKLIKRPFTVSRMNQARFNVMQEPEYTTWFVKMQQQMAQINN